MKRVNLMTFKKSYSLQILSNFAFSTAIIISTIDTALAQRKYPYSCTWTSEVTPNAVIKFNSTDGVGTYNGVMYYKGRKLFLIKEGNYQGYASNWWTASNSAGFFSDNSKALVHFSGNQVVQSLPWMQRPKVNNPRIVLVGLGSQIWYGDDYSLRNEEKLLRAGEGFWKVSKTCRHAQ